MGGKGMPYNTMNRRPPFFRPRFQIIQLTIFLFLFSFFRTYIPNSTAVFFTQIFYFTYIKYSTLITNIDGCIVCNTVPIDIFRITLNFPVGFRRIDHIPIHFFNHPFCIGYHHTTSCGGRSRHILFVKGGCFGSTLSIQ